MDRYRYGTAQKTKLTMMRKLLIALLLCGTSPAMAQHAPFDAGNLKVTWGIVTNGYQNRNATLSNFTIVNKGKTPFPANGWTLYYNFVRMVHPDTLHGLALEHVNGDLFKITPTSDFKAIAPGDSLVVSLVSDAWTIHNTDAPAGLFLVWNNEEKGYTINNYTVLPATQARQLLRFANDKAPTITPEIVFNQNVGMKLLDQQQLTNVFPTPVSYTRGEDVFNFLPTSTISADPQFQKEAALFAAQMSEVFGRPINVAKQGGTIQLEKASIDGDGYELQVGIQGVKIRANNGNGVFYGLQSLKTMMPGLAWKGKQKSVPVQGATVKDAPRFGYRSFMVDISRNFHPVDDLKKIIDVMALYKLNVLHFHFSDDEGWRLEMPSLPELTAVGAKRGFGAKNASLIPAYGSGPDLQSETGSGFYSRAQFIDLLKYAADRHIKVIPEVESPGHARAAVKSMDARYDYFMQQGNEAKAKEYLLKNPADASQYRSVQMFNDNVMDAGLPSTYKFVGRVVDDLIAMYREAGVPLDIIHMGGDELPHGAWSNSPSVKDLMQREGLESVDEVWYYYYDEVYKILQKRGIQLYGWEEVGMRKTKLDGRSHNIPNPDFANKNVQVDVWNNVLGGGAEDLAYRLANAGYKVVLSPVSNNYFDMAYQKSWDEPGFYWGGYIDVDKPFYFIPLDYYKNSKVDASGAPLDKRIFIGKDRLTDFGKSNIVGLQGVLFSETTKSREDIEYKILPRLLGLAERAWAPDPAWAIEKDSDKAEKMYQAAWNEFANVLGQRELPRLNFYSGGYLYRIPTAGGTVKDGMVYANVQLPGFTIRYTTDGKEPSLKSPAYMQPFEAKGTVKLRVFDASGRASRSVTVFEQPGGAQLKKMKKQ